MKPILGYLAGAALTLALIQSAHAQTTTQYGIGTCTGTNAINGGTIVGNIQLSVGGTLIPATFGGAVFNQAECQCKSRDIAMHVVLSGRAGPGSEPAAVMYIGAATCYDPSQRNIETCNQITNMNPPGNSGFVLNGSSFQSIGFFDITIPPEVVTTPSATTDYSACNSGGAQDETITVEVGPDMMSAYCQVPVVVNTAGPVAPGDLAAIKGDSALTLNWDVPAGTTGIDSYQVLCRKTSAPDMPAMPQEFLNNTRYYFSACIDNHLYRRTVGGLSTNSDAATTTDIPIQTKTFPIDPRLRCSDRIMANTTTLTSRISGLENGQTYDIMVVAIDGYGNATPSMVVSETPAANEGAIADYCNGGDCPGFGCQATGRAHAGTRAGAGAALAGLASLALLLRRRQAQVRARRMA